MKAAIEAELSDEARMAISPSPKRIRPCGYVKEVEWKTTQLLARLRQRWCGEVGARRLRSGAVAHRRGKLRGESE